MVPVIGAFVAYVLVLRITQKVVLNANMQNTTYGFVTQDAMYGIV